MIIVICPNCGEDNESRFAFCVKCGTTLKGGTAQKGFFAKGSGESGNSRADELAATKTRAIPTQPQPQTTAHPNAAVPQNPQMQGMPQPPQMGMMPQNPQMQGMAQPPQMGMMPQNPQMQGMPQPPQMGMMPQNPQMQGMPQMMGMFQTFVGYDQNGMPVYMQMMPQMMGYDAYGNPMYTMVPVQTYGMPPMQGVPPVMAQPQMGAMPQNSQVSHAQQTPAMPQAPVMPQTPVMPQPPAAPQTSAPVQRELKVSSYSEIPISADALMKENEASSQENVQLPNEAELLDQIFGNRPKYTTMGTGTKASAQTFSISLSASEVINVRDTDESVPPAPPAPQASAAGNAPAEKPKRKPRKKAEEKEPAPPKKTQRIVSPDEFFGDDSSPVARRLKSMKVDTTIIEDDEQLEEQLAALENGEKKRSKRTMKAADADLDAQTAVDDPAVAAAAQAILEEDGIEFQAEESKI